jgi:RNA polymerase sigma factor (TIGR02999 family)
MRGVLIEVARRRDTRKRGGGPAFFVAFDEAVHAPISCGNDLLALDEALQELAVVSPRQATIIELRFFGGASVAEIANALDVSQSTVDREWRNAKAWITSHILQTHGPLGDRSS